jgi:hypothetical protein
VRSLGRVFVVVLAVAFAAGAWQARHPPRPEPPAPARPFRTAPLVKVRPDGAGPELVGVRTGRHNGYDRVLFTFRGALPGWRVGYVPAVRADGSGRMLALRGGTYLAVAFTPARAHDARGTATFAARTLSPDYPTLRQVRLAGDFEGRVAFGLGLDGRTGFRVTELTGPARVAVDLRS